MHERTVLGLSEALVGLDAMIEAANNMPGRPVAIAIVDYHGDIVCFACMAEANPALARKRGIGKAYTSACMRVDTKVWDERIAPRRAEESHPGFASGEGGLVLSRASDGLILGGIGVSGRSNEEDGEIAEAGLEAMKALGIL